MLERAQLVTGSAVGPSGTFWRPEGRPSLCSRFSSRGYVLRWACWWLRTVTASWSALASAFISQQTAYTFHTPLGLYGLFLIPNTLSPLVDWSIINIYLIISLDFPSREHFISLLCANHTILSNALLAFITWLEMSTFVSVSPTWNLMAIRK